MVFLVYHVCDYPYFIESSDEDGMQVLDEYYSELFVFGYDGEIHLYDWDTYEFPYCMFPDPVGVLVFPV